MPRAKKPPQSAPQRAPAPVVRNGPTSEVLTLNEAASYLRLSESAVLRLVEVSPIPKKV
jgi:hypothetical protein